MIFGWIIVSHIFAFIHAFAVVSEIRTNFDLFGILLLDFDIYIHDLFLSFIFIIIFHLISEIIPQRFLFIGYFS